MPSPLLSQVRASEVHEANRVAIAAVVFALITYVVSLFICCRRRCCNSKLGVATCCIPSRLCCIKCDGRLVSRKWGRYVCLFLTCTVLCGVLMTSIFFGKFEWTKEHQLQSTVPSCNYTTTELINPCTMSYQVFWSSISSYVVFICVVIISWNSVVLLLPCYCCYRSVWTRYAADDEFDGDIQAYLGKHDAYALVPSSSQIP